VAVRHYSPPRSLRIASRAGREFQASPTISPPLTLPAITSGSLDEWRVKLATMEGAWAPMQTPPEIYDDPQALVNGYLTEVDGGDKGKFQVVSSPVQFDLQVPSLCPSPEMGQHTEEVLLEHGLSWEDIAALKASGAIL
jgi:crotonobetainyl-CoA:carnitine CoA-transferase CaiB-like acyl-CoA transferase